MSEYIDIFDDSMNYIGTASRSEVHAKGYLHRSFHCWLIRRDGDKQYVLFQLRGPDKEFFPNTLDITAAGHIAAGEGPIEGVREISEELGISVDYTELIPLGMGRDLSNVGSLKNREFCYTFLLESNLSLESYSLEPDEVTGLVQMEVDDGIKLFTNQSKCAQITGYQIGADYTKHIGNKEISKEAVIPRDDSYYLRIFETAKRYFRGDQNIRGDEPESEEEMLTHRTTKLKQLLEYLSEPDLSSLKQYSPSKLLVSMKTVDALSYQCLVLDGPTGVGKSHLISYMQSQQKGGYNWKFVRRVTTRQRRANETDNEILSISKPEFYKLKNNNKLLYWERYEGSGALYGVLLVDLLRNFKNTIPVFISNIAVSMIIPKCAYIYFMPPSLTELCRRIESGRPDIEPQDIANRMLYNVKELQGFVNSYCKLVENCSNISVLCLSTDQEEECAKKVWELVLHGHLITDLPNQGLCDFFVAEDHL